MNYKIIIKIPTLSNPHKCMKTKLDYMQMCFANSEVFYTCGVCCVAFE